MFKGLGWIDGVVSPHYNQRVDDFDKIVAENFSTAYGIEDDSALLIENGEIVGALSSGGNVYRLKGNGDLTKEKI
jgi:hypothetical protein